MSVAVSLPNRPGRPGWTVYSLERRLFSVLRNRTGRPTNKSGPAAHNRRGLVLTLTAAYLRDQAGGVNIFLRSVGECGRMHEPCAYE